jgi:protease secretion system membrane fusion protein
MTGNSGGSEDLVQQPPVVRQGEAPGTPTGPDANYGKVIRFGYHVLGWGFGGFLAWGIIAPLDEAVPAPGVIAVESKRKRVDHLTGGIVERILVREGQTVVAGQDLLVLDEAQAKAALNGALGQWHMALAAEARLEAERRGLPAVVYPKPLTAASGDPTVAEAIRSQDALFRSRRQALEGELKIIRESVRGLELQVRSLDLLRQGREKQLALFNEQLDSYRKLSLSGYISRNQLLEVERQLAELQSKQSEDLSNIASVNARLAEFRMRGAQREFEYRREVETQLADIQKEASTLGERLSGLRDTHERLVLKAPVTGTVVDLVFHTIGGVIKPGDRILDIVPAEDALIVEAQVPTQFIDRVKVGLDADVHFDAFVGRYDSVVVAARLVTVSADALTEQRTGQQFYTVRASISGSELAKLGGARIQPGMQCVMMIKTGERSLLAYLGRPFLRRFIPAMSER